MRLDNSEKIEEIKTVLEEVRPELLEEVEDENIILLTERQFHLRKAEYFIAEVRALRFEKGLTWEEAYPIIEAEYQQIYSCRRYKNFNSFETTMYEKTQVS